MNRIKIKKFLLFAGIFMLLQYGCSSKSPVTAGGGTNVKNAGLIKGRVVSSGGDPVKDAHVMLAPADYLPFAQELTQKQDTSHTYTDFNGIYLFRNVEEGEYSIQVSEPVGEECALIKSNVIVKNDSLTDMKTDTLKESGTVVVHLFKFRPPKGIVFIPATDIYKEIDSTTNMVVFNSVPEGAYSEIGFALDKTDPCYEPVYGEFTVTGGDTLALHQYTSLVVSGDDEQFLECDSLIVSQLQSIGVGTEVVDDDEVTAADTSGIDFILVSPSASSQNTELLKRLPVSIILSQTSLYPLFDMTDERSGLDYSVYDGENFEYSGGSLQVSLEMRNSLHPIATGLSGSLVFLHSAEYIVWGVPLEKAQLVASNSLNSDQLIIFTYERGEMMRTFHAPARRIALSYHKDIYPSLNEIGWKLFRGCVRFALGFN